MLFFFLSFLFIFFVYCYIKQYQKNVKANKIYLEAQKIERENNKHPYAISQLEQCLRLYKKCQELVNQPKFTEAIYRCQQKINNCKTFLQLIDTGKYQVEQKQYREALYSFIKAEKIFITQGVTRQKAKCTKKIKEQEKYEPILESSKQKAKQGKFQEAINLIKPALEDFSCEEGQQLLKRLEIVLHVKQLYYLGLIAEQKGNISEAKFNYLKAIDFLPELAEPKIRLSIIIVKENPKQAISYLEGIDGEQAAYIRGFAFTQLGNWQQVNKEWESINNSNINSQIEIIKTLAKRDLLLQVKAIESAINGNNLEIAEKLSQEFFAQFGLESIIKQNLENHIQPLLKRQLWQTQNWQQIAIKTEQIWLEQQNIESLHNLAIATYYQAQINPDKLTDFIIVWSTALANIEQNPTLQNVPWLENNSIEINNVFAKLKQILENTIDPIKDNDIEKYLTLRDIYRREILTLSLIQQKDCGVRLKQQLFILPGFYQRFCDYHSKIKLPPKIWGALYTDWGLAVAACLEGNTARAIKIKPSINPITEVDCFAYCLVSYHEGCHYLQNLQWRKAVNPLQNTLLEIQINSEWCKQIDKLCETQRQKINDFDEHLQFSKFWYQLVNSPLSKSYFAEFKAREIAEKLSEGVINHQQCLDELKEIQSIDNNNFVVLELIKTVKTIQESQKIDFLLQQGWVEEAVKVAKNSFNEDIRFRLAELCLEIIFDQIQNSNLSYETFQYLNQIAQWAYELCPHEPQFQLLYRQLREIGIRC